jgi:N-acetylmuramoyl-L-alanine amidase
MGAAFAGCASVRPLLVLCAALVVSASAVSRQAVAQTAPPADGVTVAANTTLGGDKTRTRFVIGLEKAVDYQVFSLPNPNRVIVDFAEVKLVLPQKTTDGAVGLVQSFYGGQAAPGKTRVVIDVTGAVVVEKATLERGKDGKSPRLVLDIVPVNAAKQTAAVPKPVGLNGLGATGVQPPAPKSAQRPLTRDTAIYKPIIVIDPGHGGHDSGAQRFGAVEKDVVLAFSLKLREKLLASGRYKVLMTRDSDKFVELDERRAFGDRSRAALFIAVHADYAGSSARGATIYSLRDSTSKGLQGSAKQEAEANVLSQKELEAIRSNKGDVSAVSAMLGNLGKREIEANKDRTQLFSKSVIEFMGASTPMMSNPDREANFRVLKSAKTPSVLIELAYVTNAQDAKNLKSDEWRDKVTGSLLTAIENYFSHREARLP